MSAIFLSASVPLTTRGTYHETANPFLIQCAVRELVIVALQQHKIVWGGHPAITPMIWSICEDLNIDYSEAVILYQSRFFEDYFPVFNDRQCHSRRRLIISGKKIIYLFINVGIICLPV